MAGGLDPARRECILDAFPLRSVRPMSRPGTGTRRSQPHSMWDLRPAHADTVKFAIFEAFSQTAAQPTDAHLPATDPAAAGVLGPSGLRVAAALRHGSGRRYVAHRDVPACARTRALARRVRAAVAPAEGRPLWRKPEPAAALLPVPGGAEALACRTSSICTSVRSKRSASTSRRTTSASSRTTGRTRRSARGASAGKCG